MKPLNLLAPSAARSVRGYPPSQPSGLGSISSLSLPRIFFHKVHEMFLDSLKMMSYMGGIFLEYSFLSIFFFSMIPTASLKLGLLRFSKPALGDPESFSC